MVKKMTLCTAFFALLFLVGGKTVEAESVVKLSIDKENTLQGDLPAIVDCTISDGQHSMECTPVRVVQEDTEKTVYIYRYGKQEVSTTQWKIKNLEIKDSSPIIYVDATRSFEDPKPLCFVHYYNGYSKDCTDEMNVNGNVNGFCSCDGTGRGLRIGEFSYSYQGFDVERYRFYYYVVSVHVNLKTTDGDTEFHVIDTRETKEQFKFECTKTFYDGHTVDCFDLAVNPIDLFENEKRSGYAGYSELVDDTGNVKGTLLVQPLDKVNGRQEVKVTFGENYVGDHSIVYLNYPPDECKNIKNVKMGCPIPDNWRFPPNENKSPDRHVELSIRFNVSGISSGSGE